MVEVKNIAKAYSEVYEFINILGNEYIEMLSPKVYANIKENRDFNYKPQINLENGMYEKTFSKEALVLIATLNLQFWCKNEEEKTKLMQIYEANSEKEKKELEEKYGYDKIFQNFKTSATIETNEESHENNTEMIIYEENKFIIILNKIKEFFKKFFYRK